jgi:hypothetical protein
MVFLTFLASANLARVKGLLLRWKHQQSGISFPYNDKVMMKMNVGKGYLQLTCNLNHGWGQVFPHSRSPNFVRYKQVKRHTEKSALDPVSLKPMTFAPQANTLP